MNEEENHPTCMALLDFSKAFDTLNHEMLLAKLKYMGVSEDGVNLLKNYLFDRQSCVMISQQSQKQCSEFIPFNRGVPQGSVLSPLLFSIYVADMYKIIKHSTLKQYADDSQVYYTNSH